MLVEVLLMRTLARAFSLLCTFNLGVALSAQVSTTTTRAPAESIERRLADAQQLRSDLAAAVSSGERKPEDALAQLKSSQSPTGLALESDADFAFAAIDIGQRLLASGKPTAAESFFREAEASLGTMIAKSADSGVREKVQYLTKRALIRANYLNKPAQAREDIDAGLRLAPNDKGLLRQGRSLTTDKAESILATKSSSKG
jgi:hypothetical protein